MTNLTTDAFVVSLVQVANTLPMCMFALAAGVSRAIGPALAGAMVGPLGIAAPFVVNAVSNFGSIGALVWWREPKKTSALPVEPFGSAIRIGFRYAANNPHLRGTLIRAVAFFFFASAYWARLPLVARSRIGGGREIYGILLGAIGLGAVAGAFRREVELTAGLQPPAPGERNAADSWKRS
jgi:Transmembrane secretion effector